MRIGRHDSRRWAVLGVLLAGCASMAAGSGPPSELRSSPGWVVVSDLKLHPQAGKDGCGPVAMEMVLERWRVSAGPARVAPDHPDHPDHGVRAGDLRDRARQQGLQSFVVPGTVEDLRHELAAGHPVVLGLARRQMLHAYFHFVVLAGASQDLSEWLLADPDRGWRRVKVDELMTEWNATNRVMVVTYPKTAVSYIE